MASGHRAARCASHGVLLERPAGADAARFCIRGVSVRICGLAHGGRRQPGGKNSRTFLESDRGRGFDLDTAPLIRLHLFRLGECEYKFVWTFHHAVLDGRSFVIVLREVVAAYEAMLRRAAPELPPAPRYCDFIQWLGKKDSRRLGKILARNTERLQCGAWRSICHGAAAAVPRITNMRITLSREVTAGLDRQRRGAGSHTQHFRPGRMGVAPCRGTAARRMLFLALCAHAGILRRPGRREMAGLFINTLPMRATVTPELAASRPAEKFARAAACLARPRADSAFRDPAVERCRAAFPERASFLKTRR